MNLLAGLTALHRRAIHGVRHGSLFGAVPSHFGELATGSDAKDVADGRLLEAIVLAKIVVERPN